MCGEIFKIDDLYNAIWTDNRNVTRLRISSIIVQCSIYGHSITGHEVPKGE